MLEDYWSNGVTQKDLKICQSYTYERGLLIEKKNDHVYYYQIKRETKSHT